jgi:osmotically-inducible protein OsmY
MSLSRNTHWLATVAVASLVASGCNKSNSNTETTAPAEKTEPAAPAPAKTPETLNDSDISTALKNTFARDPGVDEGDIDVKVTNGIAELTGDVDNLLSKRRVVLLAETVRGVRSVSDRIELDLKERPDGELEKDVKNALLVKAATDSFEIQPRSESGVVTLTGKVQSWQERVLKDDLHVAAVISQAPAPQLG